MQGKHKEYDTIKSIAAARENCHRVLILHLRNEPEGTGIDYDRDYSEILPIDDDGIAKLSDDIIKQVDRILNKNPI